MARANIRRAGVTEAELIAQVRKQGIAEVEGVVLAVAEVDGSVSVVPADHASGGGGGG
jgi:uncharacterized membrane protein YcaP (DUF421 family)